MRIRRTLNPKLEIEGILLTMYDERTTLSRQVATDLRSFFGAQVFQALIPRNVRLAEAPSFGKPIIFYDIHSKGAEGYTQLAQEVIINDEKRIGKGARSAHSGAGTAGPRTRCTRACSFILPCCIRWCRCSPGSGFRVGRRSAPNRR